MQCQQQMEQYLRGQQVAYQIQHHPMAYTAQRIAESEHISGSKVAKSVVVFADNTLVLLVLPASHRVDLTRAAACLGASHVRLAQEGEFQATFPDCAVGAMPPFGNLYKIPVYVDQSLAQQETIVFPVGTHTETMSIKYADFVRLVQPKVVDFIRRPLHA